MSHKTVLKNETIEALVLKPGAIVFEGTGGEGGLSLEIARLVGRQGTLVVTDLDGEVLIKLREKLENVKCRIEIVQDNFRNIKSIMTRLAITTVDAIVLDLGLCSYQIEESGRGFSFDRDEPLSMTFASGLDKHSIKASDVVNNWSEESLADIIWGFGGERLARRIARAIVVAREVALIKSSSELAKIVSEAKREYGRGRKGTLHPATKTFQAIRMAVNDEVGALRQILVDGWQILDSAGRFAVISFHEIEDRIVKRFFLSKVNSGEGELCNKKPISAGSIELKDNPRSRSAKLRIAIKNKK